MESFPPLNIYKKLEYFQLLFYLIKAIIFILGKALTRGILVVKSKRKMTYEDLEDDLHNAQEWTNFKGKYTDWLMYLI